MDERIRELLDSLSPGAKSVERQHSKLLREASTELIAASREMRAQADETRRRLERHVRRSLA